MSGRSRTITFRARENGDGGRRTILILGAGHAQIDAIMHCKDLGFRVLGCSYRKSDPGIALLDGYRQIDICDVEGVRAFAEEEGVAAVYSVGSDLAMPTVTVVSEALGLPAFVSPETAHICHDKGEMRAALSKTTWSLPYLVASSAEQAASFGAFPAMVKPVDSQGKRGCFRVENADSVYSRFADAVRFSNSDRVIVERYVDGPEISVNAFVRNGEIEFMMPSTRHSHDDLPGGIIKEHVLPCTELSELGRRNVELLVSDVSHALGIANGPVYFQLKLEGDEPRLLEVTPRLDGCHLWRLIKWYCGYDLLARTFDVLLGDDAMYADVRSSQPETWTLSFMSEPPGKVFDRNSYDVSTADFVCWYYETGDTVLRSNGLLENCGYTISRTG